MNSDFVKGNAGATAAGEEGGGGDGGIQYIGSGIFFPRGVSICAPSAGLDIICCNSAGGIIDLSTGSSHHHSTAAAAAAAEERAAGPRLGSVSAD